MISRFLILVAGAGLMAMAVLTYRPDVLGAAPVALGDYEAYRPFLIVAAGWMGAVIFISAIVRRNRPRPSHLAAPGEVEASA